MTLEDYPFVTKNYTFSGLFNVPAFSRVNKQMICLLNWKAGFLFLLPAILSINAVPDTAHKPQADRERERIWWHWMMNNKERKGVIVLRDRGNTFLATEEFTSQCCCQISCPPPLSLSLSISLSETRVIKDSWDVTEIQMCFFYHPLTFIDCWTVLLLISQPLFEKNNWAKFTYMLF